MTRRTVVFDVGGVIVRWQPDELMRHCFARFAIDQASAQAVRAQVFQSFAPDADWAAFDRGAVEAEALADSIAARTGLPRDGVAALIEAVPGHLQPMPASIALLERVRDAGHRLALLPNMPRPYAAHLEATHACFGWFEHCAWSGRLGVMKPQRGIIDHVQSALDLNLADAIFIDDHHGNIDAARSYGWHALHFENAAQCGAALLRDGWLR